MKYQDLCIAIQQIAQNYGVNSVFFEDVNLLNSEDVIYPALVCQLKNVQLQDGYDKYTLVLTLAKKATENISHDNVQEVKGVPANILYCTSLSLSNGTLISTGGSFRAYLYLSYLNDSVVVENDSDNSLTMTIFDYEQPVFIWNVDNGYLGYRRYTMSSHERMGVICHNSLLHVWEPNDVTIGNTSLKIISQMRHSACQTTISYTTIHAIRAALGNMVGVQVESCDVQPFKYKFRDECEGVVAEINMDVYFDSRCN